jgi:hypothetical protein
MGETASARRRSWHAAPRPRLSVMNSLVASSSACGSPSVAAQVKPASTGGSASGWDWRILPSGRTRVARQLVTGIHLTMTMVAASDSCEADGVTRLSDSHNIDGVGRSKAEQVTGGERMGGGEERRNRRGEAASARCSASTPVGHGHDLPACAAAASSRAWPEQHRE